MTLILPTWDISVYQLPLIPFASDVGNSLPTANGTVHIRCMEQFNSYCWNCPYQMFGTVYQLTLILSTPDVWNSLIAMTDTIQMFGTVYQLPLTPFRCLEQFTDCHWYYPDVWNSLPATTDTLRSDVWNSLPAATDTIHIWCLEQFTILH
jgi:hypothetical protein